MKNFFMTILIVGTVGTAQAQSEFEGFYAQAGIGYEAGPFLEITTRQQVKILKVLQAL